ncbi:MAG TPA: hypothetical protein VK158_06895 [Acidobacteriota bacterium]|nr:hypothetical protein [Acidobacteriota bacterium]
MKQKIFAVVLLLMAASLLLAGCTTQKTVADTTNAQNTQEQALSNDTVQTPPPVQPPTQPQITPAVDVIAPTNKTEIEKQQDTLDQLIADGVYTDDTSYKSPGGINEIEISVTVEGDIIQAASISVVKADSKSTRYINNVNDALTDLVVGKSIDKVSELPKQISGSSLTTTAFKKHVQTLIDTY